jgi:hypothetical protein
VDLVKKYMLHLPEGNVIMTKEEVFSRVKELVADHPSEFINGFRVWYEGFEGCGMPGTDVYECIIEALRSLSDDWEDIGPMRWEKYGVVDPSFHNLHYASADKNREGVEMLLHQFHAGKNYQGPDGRVFWIPVIEDFDMRCFEKKDGKFVGNMVEIDPCSDYAKAMVEVK